MGANGYGSVVPFVANDVRLFIVTVNFLPAGYVVTCHTKPAMKHTQIDGPAKPISFGNASGQSQEP